MKILYLTDQTYLHGGIEKVLSQKANWLADVAGDEVFLVTHNQQSRDSVYPLSDKIRRIDLGINYDIVHSYFHPLNLRKILKHRNALKRLLGQIQPDVVISCSFGPDFHFIPHIAVKIPKIKEFHSSRFFQAFGPHSLKDRWMAALNARAEKKYDQLVVLNPDELPFYHSDRISVIPNPTETSAYRADTDAKKILAAGRISPVKNFGDLIRAFAALAEDFPDWELHFFGEDYLQTQKQLELLSAQLGVSKQVRFMGVTADLRKSMQQYSLYAMTSETECFPMVLLEALSTGLPVISHDAPTGPKHILTDREDSLLVPYQKMDIFAQQLRRLMADAALRNAMGQRAVENARKFEMGAVMQQWQQLFNALKHG